MGLRAIAESDLSVILEDAIYGFGWSIIVTDTLDVAVSMTGFSNDIASIIDPETGMAVSGRLASVALRMSTLIDSGIGLPKGIEDSASKPWRVTFNDIVGLPYTFKVSSSNPDRALGIVTCILENYL